MFDINVFKNKQMALIRLENASAKNVLENIEKIFDGYGGLKEGKYFLSTIEDMNALICITSIKEIIDEVKFWAEKFEKESEVGEARIFIYHVENAKASDLATIIKEIYAEDHAEAKGEDPTARVASFNRRLHGDINDLLALTVEIKSDLADIERAVLSSEAPD